jgi:hypothetical protein
MPLFCFCVAIAPLCIGRKHLLSFGALVQHFALNETAEHLQASLGHLQLIQSGRVTAGLLTDLTLNLGKHDVAAINGRGHHAVFSLRTARGTSTQNKARGHQTNNDKNFCVAHLTLLL